MWVFLSSIHGATLFAQDNFTLNKSNGLVSNTVYHIIQDSNQYIWMTTDMGVVKYDGQNLLAFDKYNNLNCNENFEILKGENGDLIFTGENGTLSAHNQETKFDSSLFYNSIHFSHFVSEYFISSKNEHVFSSFGEGILIINDNIKYKFNTKNGLLDNYVSFIFENNGNIYGISKRGIIRINNEFKVETIVVFDNPIYFARAVQNNNGNVIFTGRENVFLFNTNDKLIQLINGSSITQFTPTKLQIIDNKYALSSYHGLHYFEIINNKVSLIKSILPNEEVSSILIDHESNIWVSTLTSGIIRLPIENLTKIGKTEAVNCMFIDSNKIYFGLHDLKLATLIDDSLYFEKITPNKDYKTQKINNISIYNDKIWLDSDGGLIIKTNESVNYYRTGKGVSSIFNNQVFIGNKSGCYKLNAMSSLDSIEYGVETNTLVNDVALKLLDLKINCFTQYGKSLLIGSEEGVYEYTQNSIIKWNLNSPNENVSHIAVNEKYNIISYLNNGIYVFNEDSSFQLNAVNGLSSNYCYKSKIIENYLLIATSKGLNIIDISNGFNNATDINVLLKNKSVYDFDLYNDKLYITTNSGIYVKNGFSYKEKNYQIPLQTVSILINHKKHLLVNESTFNYNQNNIAFDFNFISFKDKSIQKYYSINGSEWTTFDGQLLFNDLSPGGYHLQMKAQSGKRKSNIFKFNFTISPPWWSTWWFYISLFAILSLIVYWFFKVRILTYNRDIVKEILQVVLNKLKKEKFIIVKNVKDGAQTKVVLSQLLFIESSKNYLTLHLEMEKIMIRMTLKELHQIIINENSTFFRCHKSFIINTQKISGVHGEFFKIGEFRIPIGKIYLKSAQEKIKMLD